MTGIYVGASEIKNIYVGTTPVKEVYVGDTKIRPINFATQGPCPDGFHVPLKDEWSNVINILSGYGITSSSGYGNYLLLPLAGSRARNTGNSSYQGTSGNYWTSTNDGNTYGTQLSTYGVGVYTLGNAVGASIRPFKNIPVVPDSSWTALYSDKIYHNSTLGLISILDGTSWITIADKNLGATSTNISNSNSYGYLFQRGNNYGFANSGTITTSTTLADVSSYGPGNYYSSSTFITVSTRPYNRYLSNNANLRGGEDGNVPV